MVTTREAKIGAVEEVEPSRRSLRIARPSPLEAPVSRTTGFSDIVLAPVVDG